MCNRFLILTVCTAISSYSTVFILVICIRLTKLLIVFQLPDVDKERNPDQWVSVL